MTEPVIPEPGDVPVDDEFIASRRERVNRIVEVQAEVMCRELLADPRLAGMAEAAVMRFARAQVRADLLWNMVRSLGAKKADEPLPGGRSVLRTWRAAQADAHALRREMKEEAE